MQAVATWYIVLQAAGVLLLRHVTLGCKLVTVVATCPTSLRHSRPARRSALQRVAMPPYAVALDGRCDDHYDEGNGKWCYVKGGVACANAFAAEELVGAAWIDCGFCDHATANDILSPIARSASFRNVRTLVEAIQALDPSCSSQALATIAAVCGEACANERLHLQVLTASGTIPYFAPRTPTRLSMHARPHSCAQEGFIHSHNDTLICARPPAHECDTDAN
jgi:hypothetical protein